MHAVLTTDKNSPIESENFSEHHAITIVSTPLKQEKAKTITCDSYQNRLIDDSKM